MFLIKLTAEMNKILFFVLSAVFCIFNADGAVRDTNTSVRGKNTTVVTNKSPNRSISNRSATKKSVSARQSSPVSVLKSRGTTTSVATRTPTSRSATNVIKNTNSKKLNVSARAATQAGNIATETRTGAAYEQCKTAFFTCMDQFCELKNDNFRRCSCNDRVFGFQEISEKYQNVSEQLTEFSENLDVVGMTKEQATAMKTATEGEDALTEDKSASKQLLQAIMNAIKGEDSTVGGKYKDLNSITISPDTSFAFGMNDYGQIIASYNGANLYKAVFPQCRNAVKDDCNNASLQRAINAYLMAIEQDCNTVENALSGKQKTLKASVYEGSAMLDLARVENRQNRNSDDIATCLVNVENAILSEEVCGSGYHKCLDNGQYIDVTTGAPLTGVHDFYKLGTLLTFKSNENLQNQKLSYLAGNKKFVEQFENKTKKFAKDALNKCTEKADQVWQEYLDRALLDIYYAQQEKVKTIQNSCFDLVAACYDKQDTAIETAMANITGEYGISIQPAKIQLTQEMCSDYIESCNNMFAGDIINKYITEKTKSDKDDACRAIVQKCFDDFGGTGYENFYSLHNGLITEGEAIKWFVLFDKTNNDDIISPCAKELANTEGCEDRETIERVFGGLDKDKLTRKIITTDTTTGLKNDTGIAYFYERQPGEKIDRFLRPWGVATNVYNQIIDNLSYQCEQLNGKFVPAQLARRWEYGYKQDDFCRVDIRKLTLTEPNKTIGGLTWFDKFYHFLSDEYLCPQGYSTDIDTNSWGMCSCWENNFYRSKNGLNKTCKPILPLKENSDISDGSDCPDTWEWIGTQQWINTTKWCNQQKRSKSGKVCPTMKKDETTGCCVISEGDTCIIE